MPIKNAKLSLETYATLSFVFLAQSSGIAQTLITDIEPDERIMNWREDGVMNDTIALDIDDNGINDLIFDFKFLVGGYGDFASINVSLNDAVTGFMRKGSDWDSVSFGVGDTISSLLAYGIEPLELYYASRVSYGYGSWGDYFGIFTTDSFLGIKLLIADSVHYGWVRLSIKTLGDEDGSQFRYTGAPLTIFEYAYNESPNEKIICDALTLPEEVSILNVQLVDLTDANDITDLNLQFYIGDTLDFSELRFYLMSSKFDILSFSVDEALALEENRFFRIPADSILLGEYNSFKLPSTLLDNNGNEFSTTNYYSGFFIKIPFELEAPKISLSSPLDVMKPVEQYCELQVSDIKMVYNEDGFFEITFNKDVNELDISQYGVGFATHGIFIDYDEFIGLCWEYVDLSNIITIPITGDSVYVQNLESLTFDIYGNPLVEGRSYDPVVFGFGDQYLRDLMCWKYAPIFLQFPQIVSNDASIQQSLSQATIIQSDTKSITIQISGVLIEKFTLELHTLRGELVGLYPITLHEQIFTFPELPNGIYMAIIKQNAISQTASKIIFNQ